VDKRLDRRGLDGKGLLNVAHVNRIAIRQALHQSDEGFLHGIGRTVVLRLQRLGRNVHNLEFLAHGCFKEANYLVRAEASGRPAPTRSCALPVSQALDRKLGHVFKRDPGDG